VTFNVEVVLKGRDFAITEAASIAAESAAAWDEAAVREVLVQMLRAIDRAENPEAPARRSVVLRGFSWIVEPVEGQVVIAIEIPMGAAVAGPFAIDQATLHGLITHVVHTERQLTQPQTIH
jgi:hypothetical protein